MVKVKNKRNSKLADKVQSKKNASVQKKKLNPFEVHINREKLKVLGQKSKHDRGLPGVSRSKAIQKRKETLGTEFKLQHKTNTFIDRRIGEKDTQLSSEERILARFAAERAKQHNKKNLYNLADDEVLTHRGQTLEQIEKFDDPRSSDDEDDDMRRKFGGLDDEFVSEGHFGGGILKNTAKDGAKSHKDLIDQLIAESKKRKAEKQKEKEQTLDLTEKLDSEWKDLQPVVLKKARVEESLIDKLLANDERNGQDYDKMMMELRFEKRGTPSDGLKTDEKKSKEEREKLALLEKEREQRMLGEEERQLPRALPGNHRSAEDLDDNFELDDHQEYQEYMLAYDKDGNPLVPEHVLKANHVPGSKKNYNDGVSDSSEDDDDDDEESSDDQESGDDDDQQSDNQKVDNTENNHNDQLDTIQDDQNDVNNDSDSSVSDVEDGKGKSEEKQLNISSNRLTISNRLDKSDSKNQNCKENDTDVKQSNKKQNDNNTKKDKSNLEKIDESKKSTISKDVKENDENDIDRDGNDIPSDANDIESDGNDSESDIENSREDFTNLNDLRDTDNSSDDENDQINDQTDVKIDGTDDEIEPETDGVDDGAKIASFFDNSEEGNNLKNLLSGKSPAQQSIAIEKLIKSHDPSLGESNKESLSRLFAHLLQYINDLFTNLTQESDVLKSFLIFDKLTPHLYDLAHLNKVSTKKYLAEVLREKHEDFKRNTKLVPNLDTLVIFKLVSLIYPTSDFRHPITTPSLIFMTEILRLCKFRDARSVSRGLFITSLVLEYTVLSKRFVPAAINFLRGVIYLASNTCILNPIQVVPPFNLHKDVKILKLEDDCSKMAVENKMAASDLVLNEIGNGFKIRCLQSSVLMLKEFFDNYSDIEALEFIFDSHIKLLSRVDVELYPKKVGEMLSKTLSYMKESLEVITYTPLTKEKKKPKTLRLYEPDVQEVFTGSKNNKQPREKIERDKLKHKYKRAMKGALREIRRDKSYIASIKMKQRLQSDNIRKEKVKQIYKEASIQQGELNKMKRMK